MAYRLDEHYEIPGTEKGTRHLTVLVNPEVEADYLAAVAAYEAADPATRGAAPADPRVYESFQWGMDVSLAAAKRETKALLDQKYKPARKELAGVGTNL